MDPMISAERLTKHYGDFVAVKGVSFAVRRGEIFGLLGPNGAGKTSTINMLTGLARVTDGSFTIAGIPGPSRIKDVQRLIGVVPDESNLYDEMDGFDNLCFCASLYGVKKATRLRKAGELLELFGLKQAGTRPFRAYSKGMKRKLTIAAALIHQPELLFLDEPTTGIDVESARQIRQLIGDLNQQGTTILLTTHYLEEAERLCSRVAFIVEGDIVTSGSVADLVARVQQETVVQLAVSQEGTELCAQLRKRFPTYTITTQNTQTLRLTSTQPPNLIPFVQFLDEKGVQLYEAKIIRPSLEDVFVKVTGMGAAQLQKEKAGKSR